VQAVSAAPQIGTRQESHQHSLGGGAGGREFAAMGSPSRPVAMPAEAWRHPAEGPSLRRTRAKPGLAWLAYLCPRQVRSS